ncbi:MAG: YraN family protein [Bacteroidales bacterium]|nr:YraN family protein [Bacteroidales bacterium]
MNGRITQGRLAENIALEWLQKEGMELRERNWRSEHKEIDLIMESPDFLHIVEVKSLKAPSPIAPFEQVDWLKQRFLVRAARRYIRSRNITKEVRFDIVSIMFHQDGKIDLEFIPAAFFPMFY